MNSNITPSSISDKAFLSVFDDIAARRLDGIDLTPLLVYLLDLTPSEYLSELAGQFGVLGVGGWSLAANVEEQRELIKSAIRIQRIKGTPGAIKKALIALGYYDVKIIEGAGISVLYDGTYTHNAAVTYGTHVGAHWAQFKVSLLDLGETKGFSGAELALITEVINEYKNERSWLIGITAAMTLSDDLLADDLLNFTITTALKDEVGVTHYYNSEFLHDGEIYYGAETDVLQIFTAQEGSEIEFFGDISDDITLSIIETTDAPENARLLSGSDYRVTDDGEYRIYNLVAPENELRSIDDGDTRKLSDSDNRNVN